MKQDYTKILTDILGNLAHPELKSRPNRPHPLFRGFVEAALKKQDERK